jgi:mono/diheme cytochrome c family protein
MKRGIAIAAIALLALVAIAVYWMKNMAGGFSARANPSALEAKVARTARKLAVPVVARDHRNPLSPTEENLSEAKDHFADHCAICHSNNGSGQTQIGLNLYPKAPDMRLADTQNLTDGEIYYVIHNGIRLSGMSAWGTDDKDDDSWKLVLFIRHLPQLTADEEQEMKRLNPKSPEEMKEEQEEEEFLNEGQPSDQSTKSAHHKH